MCMAALSVVGVERLKSGDYIADIADKCLQDVPPPSARAISRATFRTLMLPFLPTPAKAILAPASVICLTGIGKVSIALKVVIPMEVITLRNIAITCSCQVLAKGCLSLSPKTQNTYD